MKASVVIPTLNHPEAIKRTLNALNTQTVRADQYEVIVVDDGSAEEHRSAIERFVALLTGIDATFIYQGVNSGKAKAVNAGLRRAKYELVLLTDDDCVPAEDWIGSHIRIHERIRGSASVVGHITLPFEWINASNFCRYINSRYIGNRFNRSGNGKPLVVPPKFFSGGNVSVPLEILIRVGMFNESISRGQDVELGFRLWEAGIPLIYCPNASIVHYAETARDIDRWISVLIKAFYYSVPQFEKLHPGASSRFGHWFLARAQYGQESIHRIVIKYLVRSILHHEIAELLKTILKRMDRNRFFFWPAAFKYVLASACLEAVKEHEQLSKGTIT